jgi:gluconolactonase
MNCTLYLLTLLLGFASCVASAQDATTLTAGAVETLAEDFVFTEGPAWTGERLLFSDVQGDIMYAYDPEAEDKAISVFRKPSGKSNGLFIDKAGRLIACEHWNRRVSVTGTDGEVKTLVDSYEGKKLNSPNDLIVHSSGALYFTDPTYGLEKREKEQAVNGLFRLAPGGKLIRLQTNLESINPNGLAFSPDEKRLYVNASKWNYPPRHVIHVFDVQPDGMLKNEREFAIVKGPDGMVMDTEGRLYVAASKGVVVFDSSGREIETITFPASPANVTFGGKDLSTLYVTAQKGLYRVPMKTKGMPPKGEVWKGK